MHLRMLARTSEVADVVESLSRSLLQRWTLVPTDVSEFEKFFYEYSWRRRPSQALRTISGLVPEIFWTGIYGVGIGVRDHEYEFPVVIAHDDLVSSKRTEELLAEVFDIHAPSNLEYLGVQEPELDTQFCLCSGRGGTLGTVVLTQANTRACLTAGHVANPVGARVTDIDESFVGVVSFSQDPSIAPSGRLSADVAVVETLGQETIGAQFKGIGTGLPGEEVVMFGSSGINSGTLFAYAPWVAIPALVGFWADIYLTDHAISQRGDSGAAVITPDSERVIGHVVGASRPATTYIQDIEFQLAVSGTRIE